MYKNQLQELAQRSCFNLPTYTCIREGPDHAPRFKSTVNFNGEIFECRRFFSTLRQAEHSAADVALKSLSNRAPSHALAARIMDETGVYKNLLQEISQRVGAPLPQYTTFRSGVRYHPMFTGIVELAGVTFTGDAAKNKKQAEKNAALSAWYSLKQLAKEFAGLCETGANVEIEQATIARALIRYCEKEKISPSKASKARIHFRNASQRPNAGPASPQPRPATASRILSLIYPKSSRTRQAHRTSDDISTSGPHPTTMPHHPISPVLLKTHCPAQEPRPRCASPDAPYVAIRMVSPVFSTQTPIAGRHAKPARRPAGITPLDIRAAARSCTLPWPPSPGGPPSGARMPVPHSPLGFGATVPGVSPAIRPTPTPRRSCLQKLVPGVPPCTMGSSMPAFSTVSPMYPQHHFNQMYKPMGGMLPLSPGNSVPVFSPLQSTSSPVFSPIHIHKLVNIAHPFSPMAAKPGAGPSPGVCFSPHLVGGFGGSSTESRTL